jgi:hypothetical protein
MAKPDYRDELIVEVIYHLAQAITDLTGDYNLYTGGAIYEVEAALKILKEYDRNN